MHSDIKYNIMYTLVIDVWKRNGLAPVGFEPRNSWSGVENVSGEQKTKPVTLS